MRLTQLVIKVKGRYFEGSIFRKNASLLLAGTAFSLVITTLVMPVLSRLYTPEQFGNLALFTSITTIATIIATGQYELAITLPKKKASSLNVGALSLLLTLLVSLMTFFVVMIFKTEVSRFIPASQFTLWLYFVPLSIFMAGLNQILYYWVVYKRSFKRLALNSVYKAGFVSVSQVIYFYVGVFKEAGLLIGQVVGQIIAVIFLLKPVYKEEKHDLFLINKTTVKSEALKYQRFPKYSLPASLINNIANQLPVILLSNFFGFAVVGQYALTQRILSVPGALISQSILAVFKERASRDYRETNSCRGIYIKTFKALLKLSIIPFAILFIATPKLIPFIFGPEWITAGVYAQILTIMFFFRFIASPLSYVLIVAEKQQVNLFIQISLLTMATLSLFTGKYVGSAVVGLTLFSIGYSVLYLFMLIVSYKFSINNNLTRYSPK